MNKQTIIKWILHLISASVIFSFFIFSANKYDWMQQMEPSIATLPTDNSAGSRLIFTVLGLVTVLVAQTYIAFKQATMVNRLFSIFVMVVALVTWFLKCL